MMIMHARRDRNVIVARIWDATHYGNGRENMISSKIIVSSFEPVDVIVGQD